MTTLGVGRNAGQGPGALPSMGPPVATTRHPSPSPSFFHLLLADVLLLFVALVPSYSASWLYSSRLPVTLTSLSPLPIPQMTCFGALCKLTAACRGLLLLIALSLQKRTSPGFKFPRALGSACPGGLGGTPSPWGLSCPEEDSGAVLPGPAASCSPGFCSTRNPPLPSRNSSKLTVLTVTP